MSNDMNDDKLNRLGQLNVPPASDAARQRAMAASMMAFEAAKIEETKKIAAAPQGLSWGQRLKSMISNKGTWTMDIRIPVGTAAIALLLLPLGFQLYSSTSLTGVSQVSEAPAKTDVAEATKKQETTPAVAPKTPASTPDLRAVAQAESLGESADTLGRVAPPPPSDVMAPEPVPMEDMAVEAEAPMQTEMAVSSAVAPMPAIAPAPAGGMAMDTDAYMPAPEVSGDEFTRFQESPVKSVAEAPVSTFSIDVDTASYSYVRRQLTDGYLPQPDAVRIEEMINYFPYDYPAATSKAEPFKPTIAIYPTPWNPKTQLLHIGIKGYVPTVEEDKPANLVFLLDTSGSMDEPDKLPLLKRAFSLLVDTLSDNDTVSIVTYAGSAGVALEPTKASDKAKILASLVDLYASGSTAGGEGIELAYRLAEQSKVTGGINRVILATDGDFNVGISDPDDLEDFIKTKRDAGISLSVLGFGQGNLDDATMQALAQNGNGNAAYIDSFREAQKVLVAEGGSTLEMIAKDVKIQVEFNPAFVSEYRLIGYETRALNREDFNNDKVDAGDIGAGHTVTAIYEITPTGSGAELIDPLRYGAEAATPAATTAGDEIAFLKMRYKQPDGDVSQLIETPITRELAVTDIAKVSDDLRFAAAVAAFGQKLKGSDYGDISWDAIRALANGAKGADEDGYRAEFVQLIGTAALLDADKVVDDAE